MKFMISEVIVSKPSKSLNLIYVTFGYVLASYIVSPLNLIFEQKLSSAIIVGGVFGAFLFYSKPIDRLIKLLLRVSSKDIVSIKSGSGQTIAHRKSDLLSSPVMAQERARINGAFFFSLSILLSDRLLRLINIYLPFEVLAFFAILMMIIAIWEVHVVVNVKLDILPWYYIYSRLGEMTNELRDAINIGDWTLAHDIINRQLHAGSIYASAWGICPRCASIVKIGRFCPECGEELVVDCKKCHASLVKEGMKDIPKYCIQCGSPIEFQKDGDKK